jgi:hypothetical protein
VLFSSGAIAAFYRVVRIGWRKPGKTKACESRVTKGQSSKKYAKTAGHLCVLRYWMPEQGSKGAAYSLLKCFHVETFVYISTLNGVRT